MGIRERMQEIAEEEKIAAKEKRAREVNRQTELQAQYYEHLPEATRTQRRLMRDLRAIGVVGMIEEMVGPGTITDPLTPAQSKRARGNPQFGLGPMEKLEKIFDAITNRDWETSVILPSQREDGSLDPSIYLHIHAKGNRPMHTPERHVVVTYSPDRTLTIKGAEVFFKSIVTRQNADEGTLEIALARAFRNPEKPLVRAVDFHTPQVYGK
ncbi:MAG: hypothetical protein HYU48_02915 [Candidatus Levybacteria bacterium]|nr:hypothetical protein [Candidatus Levybacteria bacterium]